MLQTILNNIWQILLIVASLTLIVFLIAIILEVISSTIDRFKNRKIKDQTLRNLQKDLNVLMKNLDKEKK